jgi:uncharacterized protein (PEP-CTERM system associated)
MSARRHRRARCMPLTGLVLGSLVAGGSAVAQPAPAPDPAAAPPAQPWSMERSLSVLGAATNNARLSASDQRKDILAQATASLRLFGQYGAVRGTVDYALTGVGFIKQRDLNDITNRLQAAVTGELVPQQLFVDVTAQVGQQAQSLTDRQTADATRLGNSGREVRAFTVSPSWRKQWASGLSAEARFTQSHTQASGTSAFDTNASRANLRLAGGQPALSWSVDASWQTSQAGDGIDRDATLVELGLGTLWANGLQTTALAGWERNNLAGGDTVTGATWGFRAQWPLTERTQVSGLYRHRTYGHDHQLSLSHRTQSTVWTVSDTNGVSTSSVKGLGGSTLYDVYSAQFQTTEPDAVRRDEAVRGYLRTLNLDPSTQVVGGFLGASATQERGQSASVAWLAPRGTVSLRYVQTRSSLLGTRVPGLVDDFATTGVIRQRGVVAAGSYRLTPVMALNAEAQYRRSVGDNAPFGSTKSVAVSWLGQLGPRSDVTVGARYAVGDSTRQAYKEALLFAGYRTRF